MKTIAITLLACVLAAFTCNISAAENAETPKAHGKLWHVVALKFKDDASKEDITKAINAFKELKTAIPEIVSIQNGKNNSPEFLNKGFTHCFVLTFKSEKDRDAYLVHPDHKAFGKILGPVVEDVFVIDFLTEKK
ncbi:MAG: Dabb family protein [Verrucomicrobia bacterium]|nr:Dabb family protein [Verrucomicrobiota bacterium]MCF7708530.1 Dabb family protein [Verrucomicrobiota bacterium]